MRKLLFALLLSSSLNCASLYTLDNVHSLNLYFASEARFLDQDKKTALKNMVTEKLTQAGFALGETDASIFVVKIDALETKESHAVHIDVGLGEEVIAKRQKKVQTFAYTYLETKFIQTQDPYTQTFTLLASLVDAFIKSHKEDNE